MFKHLKIYLLYCTYIYVRRVAKWVYTVHLHAVYSLSVLILVLKLWLPKGSIRPCQLPSRGRAHLPESLTRLDLAAEDAYVAYQLRTENFKKYIYIYLAKPILKPPLFAYFLLVSLSVGARFQVASFM